jgi:hypothetical protein
LYESRVQKHKEFDSGFNLHKAVLDSCIAVERIPNLKSSSHE